MKVQEAMAYQKTVTYQDFCVQEPQLEAELIDVTFGQFDASLV